LQFTLRDLSPLPFAGPLASGRICCHRLSWDLLPSPFVGFAAIAFGGICCNRVLQDLLCAEGLLAVAFAGRVAFCRTGCGCASQGSLPVAGLIVTPQRGVCRSCVLQGSLRVCPTCCKDSLHGASSQAAGFASRTDGRTLPPPEALTGFSPLSPLQIRTQRRRRLPRAGAAGREALRGARDAERQVALQRLPLAPGRRHRGAAGHGRPQQGRG